MTTLAFRYWPRRALADAALLAIVGQRISLLENEEYGIEFPADIAGTALARLLELGYEPISNRTGLLSFSNFVGTTNIAGVTLEVVSTKIDQKGISGLLQQISELSSALVFGWRAPTQFGATGTPKTRPPVPYHQFQLLRHAMLGAHPGQRLQESFHAVERNATRRFFVDRPVVSVGRVKHLDGRALRSIASHIDRIAPLPPASRLSGHPLAQALMMGDPASAHFPERLAAPQGQLSFDTPENRFVRYLLKFCISLTQRFVDHPRIHESLRRDSHSMLSILEPLAAAPFLSHVGDITQLSAPSQVLTKAEGYKELWGFWGAISTHQSLPSSHNEVEHLLEGKDIARLYEYWIFIRTLEAVFKASGASGMEQVKIHRTELGESLEVGIKRSANTAVTVAFNPTFTRSSGTAYSTPLRPDVVVDVAGVRYAFDAKYRLMKFDVAEGDADDGHSSFKRADLYKMHAYRDAIIGLKSAFVVYPGAEFTFFERNGDRRHAPEAIVNFDGVGALPMRPNVTSDDMRLTELITRLLTHDVAPIP